MSEEELQLKFMNVVKEMKEAGVDLPNDFKLYFDILEHKDGRGSILRVEAFLLKENLESQDRFSGGDGKYWYNQSREAVDYKSPYNVNCTEFYVAEKTEKKSVVHYELKN